MVCTYSNDGYSERAISAKRHCSKTAVHTGIANFINYWSYNGLNKRDRPMKHDAKMIG